MAIKASGRFVPPSAFAAGTGKASTGAYAWNVPREAVGRERPLTRDEMRQVQGVLSTINRLPYFLRSLFTSRYDYIRRNRSPVHGFYFLTSTFQRRLWPRIERVNQRHGMNTDTSSLFLAERDRYVCLPGMNDKELKKFAARISLQLFMMYEELSDAWVGAHDEKESLFTDEAQAHLYGHVAGAARASNVSPLYWKKYRKGQMTTKQAYSTIARLFNDEWWTHQLKGQHMCWHEALLVTVGEVNKDRSPYASKHAIHDVRARRQANLELLKSCDPESRETGERIDLIGKVTGSISNPEIRRMELMNTIADIERYAAAEGDVGMFITLTAPSKYHLTRQVGKGKSKTVQLNHGWNNKAFNPKDTQRYPCRIWSLMRMAFKSNDLQVYGLRAIEPHHDETPHWRMMLFCNPCQRNQIIETMRRYALKEGGDERGAKRNRFQAKRLNRGGAAGYIAKYISKNIDGYALDGQLGNDTGKPLKDTVAVVTAWASTWRIPQFKTAGLPTMGAYRKLRKLPRGVSIADEFDEHVEVACVAADSGDFALHIGAQGGANVPRGYQTARIARSPSDEVNEHEKEAERVVDIHTPHLGARHIHITRTTDWRIVPKVPVVEPLTLKSGIVAPRSPVNNCGKLIGDDTSLPTPTPSEHAAAVLNLVNDGVVEWSDPEVVRALRGVLEHDLRTPNRQQRNGSPLRPCEIAPSARLTRSGRMQITRIRVDLAQNGIRPQRWELEALACGATINYDGKKFTYSAVGEWPGSSTVMGWT